MYSVAWKYRKDAPSRTVAPRNHSSCLRRPALSAWWATVTVTPEDNRISVLSSGRPHAGTIWKWPPIAAGPLLGQPAEKPGHSTALVITLPPSPLSHGIAYWRA